MPRRTKFLDHPAGDGDRRAAALFMGIGAHETAQADKRESEVAGMGDLCCISDYAWFVPHRTEDERLFYWREGRWPATRTVPGVLKLAL